MAIKLTQKNQDLLSKPLATVQLILEVNGLPQVFGPGKSLRPIVLGDPYVLGQPTVEGEPFVLGQVITENEGLLFISTSKTTKSITSQILPDQGASNSIERFKVELVDSANIVTDLMSKNNFVTDILGTEASVYILLEGASYPEDRITIFNGIIDDFVTTSTSVEVTVANPEIFRKQTILEPSTTLLSFDITEDQTNIQVSETVPLRQDSDDATFLSYFRIEDEIVKVVTFFSGAYVVIRGQLGTTAVEHEAGTEVNTLYRLTGNPFDITLKILLSSTFEDNSLTPYVDGAFINSIGQIPAGNFPNTLFFDSTTFLKDNNINVGDTISIFNSGFPANNVFFVSILATGVVDTYSYIQVDANLTDETGNGLLGCNIYSQYNVWTGAGAGLDPKYVDIERFNFLKDFFSSSPDLDLRLEESINIRDFINTECYAPFGYYSLSRDAKISVGATIPPIGSFGTKTANASNIVNANKVRIRRSVSKNFYNTFIADYGYNNILDDFKARFAYIDGQSKNAIKNLGNIAYSFQSRGLVNDGSTRNYLESTGRRFVNRYGTGAESTDIQVHWQFGFDIEIGDIVFLDYGSIGAYDYDFGSRQAPIKAMEVTNKSWSLEGGAAIKLSLLDSGFGSTVKYTVIAPASDVGTGSTTTQINLKKSYGTDEVTNETYKWEDYLDEQIIVRSIDYSFSESTIIRAVNDDNIIVDALSVAPLEDYIVEPDNYDTQTVQKKNIFGHSCPQDTIVSVVASNELEMSDISLFFVGSVVIIHDETFSYLNESVVQSISGNNIILKDSFVNVNAGDLIDQIGFSSDNGKAYGYA